MINWLAGQEHTLEPPPVRELPVVEIFGPTLQGEGSLVGQRTMFVRFGYCDGAGRSGWCRWCDSMEAVNPVNKDKWVSMTPQAIANALVAKSLKTGCRDVTFTGGNPLLHELDPLLYILSKDKEPWMKNVETQGTIFKPWLYGIDIVHVSPKPPSAGTWSQKAFIDFMDKLLANPFREGQEINLKIVVNPERDDDYTFARTLANQYSGIVNDIYLSALSDTETTLWRLSTTTRQLAEKVIADPEMPDVKVGFQFHKFLWGDVKGV